MFCSNGNLSGRRLEKNKRQIPNRDKAEDKEEVSLVLIIRINSKFLVSSLQTTIKDYDTTGAFDT